MTTESKRDLHADLSICSAVQAVYIRRAIAAEAEVARLQNLIESIRQDFGDHDIEDDDFIELVRDFLREVA